METGAILLLFSVVVICGLILSRPFLGGSRITAVSAEEQQLSALMAERDRVITTLQELDFDQTLGKIPSEDYPAMRAELMHRAAEIMRKLDSFHPAAPTPAEVESRIEAVIAARRSDAAVANPLASRLAGDDDVEALIASRKAARPEKMAGFCPECGKPILRSDRFCPHCGKAIA